MATIYPKPLPEHYLHKPEHRAEILFYNHLSQALGGEYCVFYDIAWQSRTNYGSDGQADFVLALLQRGVMELGSAAIGARTNLFLWAVEE